MTVLFDLCLNNLRHFLLIDHPIAVHIVHPENRKQNRVSLGSGLSTDFIRIFGTVRILSGFCYCPEFIRLCYSPDFIRFLKLVKIFDQVFVPELIRFLFRIDPVFVRN